MAAARRSPKHVGIPMVLFYSHDLVENTVTGFMFGDGGWFPVVLPTTIRKNKVASGREEVASRWLHLEEVASRKPLGGSVAAARRRM